MYILTIKVYNRRYENDNSYYVEEITVGKQQLDYWLEKPKTYHRELIDYRKC